MENTSSPQVNAIIDLKPLNAGNYDGSFRYVKANYEGINGDNNGGYFYFSPTSTATPDNIDVIQPNNGSGRWLRERVGFQGIQKVNAQKLLGRYTSLPDPGNIEEIQIGAGLNLTGNVLSASTGGGSVTYVGLQMPGGFTVVDSPITNSGVIEISTNLSGVLVGNGNSIGKVDIGDGLGISGGYLYVTGSSNLTAGLNEFGDNGFTIYTGVSGFDVVNFGGQRVETDNLSAGTYIVNSNLNWKVFSDNVIGVSMELESYFYSTESGSGSLFGGRFFSMNLSPMPSFSSSTKVPVNLTTKTTLSTTGKIVLVARTFFYEPPGTTFPATGLITTCNINWLKIS